MALQIDGNAVGSWDAQCGDFTSCKPLRCNSEQCCKNLLAFRSKQLIPRYYTLSKRRINFSHFTFMLPCIVIDSFLNNQPDALIIQIYSVIKLYMFGHLLCPSSGVFYCTFGTCKFHAGFWWPLPSRVRMEIVKGSTRSHCVENWLWRRRWTCRITNHGMKHGSDMQFMISF